MECDSLSIAFYIRGCVKRVHNRHWILGNTHPGQGRRVSYYINLTQLRAKSVVSQEPLLRRNSESVTSSKAVEWERSLRERTISRGCLRALYGSGERD
jgi:hypothetical protein